MGKNTLLLVLIVFARAFFEILFSSIWVIFYYFYFVVVAVVSVSLP